MNGLPPRSLRSLPPEGEPGALRAAVQAPNGLPPRSLRSLPPKGEPGALRAAVQAPNGLHLTADCSGCAIDSAPMHDADALRVLCADAVRAAGLRAVGELFHRFPPPGGVTGVVLLAESHLAVHTWPELRAATLDVYVCNAGSDNAARAQALLDALAAAFGATHVERQRLDRAFGGRPR